MKGLKTAKLFFPRYSILEIRGIFSINVEMRNNFLPQNILTRFVLLSIINERKIILQVIMTLSKVYLNDWWITAAVILDRDYNASTIVWCCLCSCVVSTPLEKGVHLIYLPWCSIKHAIRHVMCEITSELCYVFSGKS